MHLEGDHRQQQRDSDAEAPLHVVLRRQRKHEERGGRDQHDRQDHAIQIRHPVSLDADAHFVVSEAAAVVVLGGDAAQVEGRQHGELAIVKHRG
eukprot:2331490-Prymnesium_polylepis.1